MNETNICYAGFSLARLMAFCAFGFAFASLFCQGVNGAEPATPMAPTLGRPRD